MKKPAYIIDLNKPLFTLKEAQDIFFAGCHSGYSRPDNKGLDPKFMEMIIRAYPKKLERETKKEMT